MMQRFRFSFPLALVFTPLAIGAPLAAPSVAQAELSQLCERFPQNSRCAGYIPQREEAGTSRDAETGLPRVAIAGDWRTSDLDVPWSQAIIFQDPFDGGTLAVFDRNFSGSSYWNGSETGVVTKWTRQSIDVFAYKQTRNCGFLTCRNATDAAVVGKTLELKIGDQVFRLDGDEASFPVSDELATALANAPARQAMIRVNLAGSGASSTNAIGEKTVQAWKQVYQPSSLPLSQPSETSH